VPVVHRYTAKCYEAIQICPAELPVARSAIESLPTLRLKNKNALAGEFYQGSAGDLRVMLCSALNRQGVHGSAMVFYLGVTSSEKP